ncbi:5-formyltetrahydrofolate cyclo-ligase [Lipomyces arxii]|uniref:5-formyltetrahydrofolate cyclo-ligase n=1 Tax=Lipomyces arxii TaxID=56418 RepID=UPI0034D00637
MTKASLRRAVADRLKEMGYESILLQSNGVAERIRELKAYKDSSRIGLYMHMNIEKKIPRKNGRNVEIRTDKIIRNAFEDGKQVFLPRIGKYSELSEQLQDLFKSSQADVESDYTPSTMIRMIEVYHDDIDVMTSDGNESHDFNIHEPETGQDALEGQGLDLIIVPGLVFNPSKQRIGRGKGFYDNFITLHDAWSVRTGHNRPLLVGVAFEEQLIHTEFPLEFHDRTLDIVITNQSLYK